jgi:hypothetical protein
MLVEKDDVQGHFHTKGMNGFAGYNPEAGTRRQMFRIEQTATARRARTRHADLSG